MTEWLLAPLVGVLLIVMGLALVWSHRQTWGRQREDAALGDADRDHYYRQYRRRLQTSAFLALEGILIICGDVLIPWRKLPWLFAIYWGGVLLLALWVVVLGLADLLSTAAHGRALQARLRQKRRNSQQEVSRRKNHGSNGSGQADTE